MYQLNEGTIDLPDSWKDQTVNVITSSSAAIPGLSVTITRDDMPWGMAFPEYVQDQLGQAGKALKDFQVEARRDMTVADNPAVEVECRWVATQGPIHQIITTVQDGSRVLVLTASIGGRMSENQMAEMRRIVGTLRLNRRHG